MKAYTDSGHVRDPEVEAVSVCTWTTMLAQEHSKPQRGKHVLVEKPMATNTEQAQKQLDTAKANGLHLAVGFLMRSSWLTAN